MTATAARILEAPHPDWGTLLASDPNATPAHRPEVWSALGATLDGMALRFVAAEEDGALIGGAAAFVRRRGGFHWLHVLPFMLSGAPLARSGAHARVDAAVAMALEALRRDLGAVGGEWAVLRAEGPPPRPEDFERVGGETRLLETSIIDLGVGTERAWRRLEPSVRLELRHAAAAGLAFAEEPEALEEVYALHLAQGRRWSTRRAVPLELARRLLEERVSSADGPAARLFTVRDRRGVLSSMFYLDHAREILAWWSGSRDDARARHAMSFLYWSTAEWAAAAGRTRLNLGGSSGLPGLAAYKRSLGGATRRYPVRWLEPSAGRWGARVVGGLQRWARRGRYRGETP